MQNEQIQQSHQHISELNYKHRMLSFVSKTSKLCTTTDSFKKLISTVDICIDYIDAERR